MALSYIPATMLPIPGYCLVCGVDKVDCVDSGISKQFYGALLICVTCFRDGALRISELGLFDRTLHDNMIEELEEKIEWRKNLEPTVARLEADINSSLDRARRGFSQRRVDDSVADEIFQRTENRQLDSQQTPGNNYEDGEQLFFTLEELREYPQDAGQVNNDVRNEVPA